MNDKEIYMSKVPNLDYTPDQKEKTILNKFILTLKDNQLFEGRLNGKHYSVKQPYKVTEDGIYSQEQLYKTEESKIISQGYKQVT